MKNTFRFPQCFIILLLLFFSYSIFGQSSEKYFVYQYVKVPAAMENEYLKLELEVWKKIHQARINKDILDGWYLYRLISPNGSKTEYNFILVLEYNSAEKLAGHFESFGVDYLSVLSNDEIAFALKTPQIRDQVYEEVWQASDEIMVKDKDHWFRFQVFNAMSLKPGMNDEDYLQVEEEYWKPVHQMRIGMNKMHGWGLYNMIIPGGTERAYRWATVDYYDKFIDIMADNNPLISKIHGSKNLDKIIEKTDGTRDLLKTEVRELIDYVIDKKP